MDNGTVMHNSERVFVNTNMCLRLNIYILVKLHGWLRLEFSSFQMNKIEDCTFTELNLHSNLGKPPAQD